MNPKQRLKIFTVFFVLLNIFSASSYSQTVKLKYSEGYIPTNDSVKIFYRILGEGKDTIVVVHGGGFGSSYLVPDLTPIAAHHALLFFDQPGTGFSTVVRDTARLNINRFVEDVEIVRKHFRLKKMKVLAHSNGGIMFGYYATVHPENLESIILINPSPASQKWKNSNRLDSISQLILNQNNKIYRSAPDDSIKACWDYYSVWARGKFPTPLHVRRMWGDVCNCDQKNQMNPIRFYPLQSMGKWDITTQLSKVKARTLMHTIELQFIDLEQSGDILIARGKYVMNNKQDEIIDIGKFIAIYKKMKNTWRLQTDMFNTSMETRSPLEVPDYLSLPNNQ